jgi:hypothetical protein
MPKGSVLPPPLLELEELDELDDELELELLEFEELEDELLELLEDELVLEELLLDELVEPVVEEEELLLDELVEPVVELELLEDEPEPEPEPVQVGATKLPSCVPCTPKEVFWPGCKACQLQQLVAVTVVVEPPESTTFQLLVTLAGSLNPSVIVQPDMAVVPLL